MTTPDLTSYYAVHAALRGGANLLATGAATLDRRDRRRLSAFRKFWAGYVGEVTAHHTIEDKYFFPALAAQVPVAGELIGRLDQEHHELDALMAAVTDAIDGVATDAATTQPLVDALDALAAHMDAHLDVEDADILPLFARHFTSDEYVVLEQQAHKAMGIGKQAAFSVPFIVSYMTPEVRDHQLRNAPAALRVLWRLTRGRYARLTTAAFGAAACAEVS
jgi:hemerythrin-like domain-containing protein